jgi:hypothetical protein
MDKAELEKLGSVVFAQSIKPLFSRMSHALVIGFDSEYDSETDELLSIQFSHKGNSTFIDWRGNGKLTWEKLEYLVKDFLRENKIRFWKKSIKLVCFWSIAELQHLDLVRENVEIMENAKTYNVRYLMSNRRNLEVFDLFPFFLTGLAKVAESFGLQKLEWDTSKVSASTIDSKEFQLYAVNDAILCEEICNRFRKLIFDEFQTDILRTKTPANTAMSAYRINDVPEKIGQDWGEVRRMSLLASWGGNNQACVRGRFEDDFEEWDAESMYPNCAVEIRELPTQDSWKRSRTIEENLSGKGGIAHIRFEFPLSCKYPSLPVFSQGKLCYPSSGETYCTSYEIEFALKQKAKIEFIKGFHYTEGDSSLSEFIKRLTKIKDTASIRGDYPKRNMAKLLMVAIIGKFTQKKRVVPLEEYKRIALELDIPVQDAVKMWGLPVKHKILLGSGFMPEWNTLILGRARAVMAKAYEKYEALLGTTDSMIIRKPKEATIEIDGIRFKREYQADRVDILRTRLYACYYEGEIVKVAEHGLILSTREASDAIAKGIDGSPSITYSVKRPIKLRESWRRDLRFGEFLQRERTSNLGWDNKRRLLENGETRPLISVGEMI